MPLSYKALAPLFTDHFEFVDTPDQADLYVFAHSLDIEAAPQELVTDWRRRQRPLVLLSEEPFWDTIWTRQPLVRNRLLETRFGPLPIIQVNHHTSDIFRFERIPYFLLTNHRFASAYMARFARNAALSASEWRKQFSERRADLVFMFERRPEPYHGLRWPEGDIIGLCHWRTKLAETEFPGLVERLGRSWQGTGPTRQQLSNWHLDKMVRLDGYARLMAAIENTHQPNYITEKLFDAFACGALPLYFAGPTHRVHDLGLPEASWLNLFDLDIPSAAQRITAFQFDADTCEAYARAQIRLQTIFCDPQLWVAERKRLQRAVVTELTRILDKPIEVGIAPTGSAAAPVSAGTP